MTLTTSSSKTKQSTTSKHDFKVLVRPAILPGGELWFPERLNREFLEVQRQRDPYFFSAVYQNEPIPPEDQRFKPEWVVYREVTYKWEYTPRIFVKATGEEFPVYVTTTVDPAISDRKYADYTGITTVAATSDDVWYILSARRIRGGVDKVAEACIHEVQTYRPASFGIETIAFQIALRDILLDRFYERGLIPSVKELVTGTGRGKRARIEALVPRFAEGRVFLATGIGPDLERELKEWRPGAEMDHDDLIDSLSHQLTISMPAPIGGQPTPTVDLLDLPPEKRAKYKRRRFQGDEDRDPFTGY